MCGSGRGGWWGGCGRGEELPAGHAGGGSPPPPTGLGRESLQVSIARDGLATFLNPKFVHEVIFVVVIVP